MLAALRKNGIFLAAHWAAEPRTAWYEQKGGPGGQDLLVVVGPDREALARLATAVGAGRVVRHGDGYAYRAVGSSAKFALVMAFPWLPARVQALCAVLCGEPPTLLTAAQVATLRRPGPSSGSVGLRG
jgi:hypothetical protein